MSARDLLIRAPKGTTWVAVMGGWKCVIPGRALAPGQGVGRTPLDALARALEVTC